MADYDRQRTKKDVKVKSTAKSKNWWRNPANSSWTGSKEKGHAFAEMRKKMAIREYKKLIRKTRAEQKSQELQKSQESLNMVSQHQQVDNYESGLNKKQNASSQSCGGKGKGRARNTDHRMYMKRKPVNIFMAAESDFKKRKIDKEQQIKERAEQIQKHREEVRQKMEQRREVFKRLNKKTRKGQPVMAVRIEHLLEKIQAQTT